MKFFIIKKFESLYEKLISRPLENSSKKTVLFSRNYQNFTGGQLKVRNYFDHVGASVLFEPWIFMTISSDPNINNLWIDRKNKILKNFNHKNANVIFLAGPDWKFLPNKYRIRNAIPKINLIQDFWATDPSHYLNQFLKFPAIRICVSEELRDAIIKTKQANGPVIAIPNGIDLSEFQPYRPDEKRVQITIFGHKNPKVAKNLAQKLNFSNASVKVITKKMSRAEIIECYASTKIAILLPFEVEGFYLPAIEAMASGCLIIVPDCIGNRSFCVNEKNCIISGYSEETLLESAYQALEMDPSHFDIIKTNAISTAANYTIASERQKFHSLLSDIDNIWNNNTYFQ